MQVQLKLFASLRGFLPSSCGGKEEIILDKGITVQELLEIKKIPIEAAQVILVNGTHQKLDYLLQSGDIVSIFPLVAGG